MLTRVLSLSPEMEAASKNTTQSLKVKDGAIAQIHRKDNPVGKIMLPQKGRLA